MPTHRLRRTLLAVATALGLSLGAAAPALATDPVTFNGTQIIDEAGVLGSDKASLQKEVDDFRAKTGNRLYVVFVNEFTSPSTKADWASAVATKNRFSQNSALMAIAVKEGKSYIGSSKNSSMSRYDGKAQSAGLEELKDKDWDGAVRSVLAAYQGKSASGSGLGGLGILLPVLVIVAVGGFIFLRVRRKRAAVGGGQKAGLPSPQGREPSKEEIAQLRAQAGPLLIKADDAIRTSEQEMDFALAAYGEDSVKTFREDLDKAKGQLAESFKLQQQLDDDVPDTPQDQYAWLTQIIEHCNAVNAELNSHRAEFDDLRRLESNAPQIAADLAAQVAGLNQRLETGRAGLAGLSADYADSAVRQVQDNVDQAQERVSFVESAARTAQEAAAAGRNSEAAVNARAAQQALGQAEDLIAAVESTRSRLAEAGARLTDAVRAGAQDLAQAKAALANGNQPGLAAPTAALEAALNQVRTQLAAGRPDPLGLLAGVEQARSGLDEPLAAVRDAAERSQRAAQALESTIRSASAKIEGTEDYVKSRRGGVGAQARTRLAEARRLLDDAIANAGNDPQRALASAQRAEQLADAAAREAEQDVDGFQFGGYGNRGGNGYGNGGGMNGLGGVVLGGILGSILASGGSHHHSDGGGGFFGGGDGGFGGFGGGGGDFGGGGFGGFDGGGGDF